MHGGFTPCVVWASSEHSRLSNPSRAADHNFSSTWRCSGVSISTASSVTFLCSGYNHAKADMVASEAKHSTMAVVTILRPARPEIILILVADISHLSYLRGYSPQSIGLLCDAIGFTPATAGCPLREKGFPGC